jgi:hypothetical protein
MNNRLVTLVAVVLGLVAAVLGASQLRGVHARAAEYRWLSQHARSGEYPVVELGTLRPDRSATDVWVSQPGGANAFVGLEGSSQRVTGVGQQVRARLDNRDAPALGTGVAEDVLGRSFTRDYLVAGLPLLVTLVAGALVSRRRIPGRSRPLSQHLS